MYAYKVFRRNPDTGILSAVSQSIRYYKTRRNLRKRGWGPICCFERLEQARDFIKKDFIKKDSQDTIIYKVRGKETKGELCIWVEDGYMVWESLLPRGTVLVDWFEFVEEVKL